MTSFDVNKRQASVRKSIEHCVSKESRKRVKWTARRDHVIKFQWTGQFVSRVAGEESGPLPLPVPATFRPSRADPRTKGLSGVSNLGADDRSCVNLTDDWYVRQYSRSLLAARGSSPLDLDPSSEGSSTRISHRTLLRRASRVLFGIGIIEERNRDRREGLIEGDWPFLIFAYRSLFLTRPPWLSRVFSDS